MPRKKQIKNASDLLLKKLKAQRPVTAMKQFNTGATRSTDADKLDFEGFINPAVVRRYAQYLHKHRIQADGNTRESDNWQKGMPAFRYVKSLLRHVIDLWLHHRGQSHLAEYSDEEECICAVIFNASGLLLEKLVEKGVARREQT